MTRVVRVGAVRRCFLDLGAHGRVPFLVASPGTIREKARARAIWLGYKDESEIIDFVAGYVNAAEDIAADSAVSA